LTKQFFLSIIYDSRYILVHTQYSVNNNSGLVLCLSYYTGAFGRWKWPGYMAETCRSCALCNFCWWNLCMLTIILYFSGMAWL